MWQKGAVIEMDDTYFQLVREKEKLKTIVDIAGDLIYEYTIAEDSMNYLNSEVDILAPGQITENYTARITENKLFENREEARELARLLRSGQEHFEIELRRMGQDNQFHWVRVVGKTIRGRDNKPERVLGKVSNIDEQKEREANLMEKSRKDSLTGLLNHMTAKNEIKEKIRRLEAGRNAYLIVCDIDNLKKINDFNGHLFGDAVICSFADEIRAKLPNGVQGRIGGDEFIIYVENLSREQLEKRLVSMNRSMIERFHDDKMDFEITCSCGVVAINGEVTDFDALFQHADSILYEVKKSGKGTHRIVDSENNLQNLTKGNSTRNQNAEDYVRRSALIQSGEELSLFCMELMENVPNATTALKMICENICRFYGLEGMIYLECPVENTMYHGVESDEMEILYAWNRINTAKYIRKMHKKNISDWTYFQEQSDERGIVVYNEQRTGEDAEDIMIILSKKIKGYKGSIVFTNNKKDKTWEKEREILYHIAYAVFYRMRQIQLEQREQQEGELKFNYDGLSGLPMYNKFIQMAEESLKQRDKEKLFCIYSDFSNFQYLNEAYGYEVGDEVLKAFGGALITECPGYIVFSRVSSDHFTGLVRAENLNSLKKKYLDFTTAFVAKCNENYQQYNLVIASGIYEVAPEDKNVSKIVDNANEARKACKKQKFITEVVVYDEEIRRKAESEKEIIINVINACNNKEIQAYLQPKISLKTRKVMGAEALVRWIKPDGKMVMPDQFISVCEKNGYIMKIDFYVLERVLEYLHEAISLGEEVVPVSVNFSRRHAEVENFVEAVFEQLANYQIPGNLLEMEVTESVFTRDLHQINENVIKLKKKDIEISVDDFGSGYSSFTTLTELKADTIKLDRQLLKGAEEGNNKFTLLKSLIEMLKTLGFKVLMEGVETPEQVKMLEKANCDTVQGYYYAKPMPIEDFRRFLQEFNQET